MGLGGTAKKLQKVASMAEDLYSRMNEVVAQIQELQSDLEETSSQVDDLERQVTEQRALIEAMATESGVDVDQVLADLDASDPAPDQDESAATGEDEEPAEAS